MLIESGDLLSRIDKCYQESAKTGLGLEPVMAIRDIKALISVVPEVEAVPVKHGQWIHFSQEESTISGKCSCCGWEAHYYEDDVADMPYCPSCGARMDLEDQHG